MLLEYIQNWRGDICSSVISANGVAVAADGSYVLYAETYARSSVRNYWLQGQGALTNSGQLFFGCIAD
jgi:sugar lactone lactonase YvrE